MKKFFFLLTVLSSVVPASAQKPEQLSFMADPVNHPMTPFYGLVILLIIISVLVMAVGVSLIRVLNTLSDRIARERAEKLGTAYKPSPSFWAHFARKLNASVPVEEEKTIELDHSYDGIKELDNHLPPWWKWLFYGTIGWAGLYMVMYHFGGSFPLMEEEYNIEVSMAEESKRKFLAGQPKLSIDENTLTFDHDAGIIAKGKEIYSINCAPCHKGDGGGGIGPNLTDEYWLHGGDVKNIYATVKNGVPEKGMVAWASVLSPEQLRDVSFFIISIQGTNPPGAKSAQGEIFKTTSNVSVDSVKTQAKL